MENEVDTRFARTPALNKSGAIEAKESFLPQAGARYALSDDSELFVGYARNMRAFPSSGTSGPFSSTQAGFLAIRDELEPEISDTFEAGWRFRTADFQAVLAAYHVKFKDRLFAVPVGSGIVGNPITFRGPDGKQYVAVYAGIGGDWFLLAGDVNSADPADVRAPPDFAKNIGRHTSQGGIVWIFGL